MPFAEEPKIEALSAPEKTFQDSFVANLRQGLATRNVPFILLESFGLDVAVFATPAHGDRTVFFELKAFVGQRPGGVGFGNQKGFGPQIDLLFDKIEGVHREPNALARLDRNIRWALVDGTQPIGSNRFALFTCQQAQDAAMNGVRTGKQNNLRLRAFDRWISWAELCSSAVEFVAGQ